MNGTGGEGTAESAAEWGRRQAAAAPPWTERQLRAVAGAVGIRLDRRDTETTATERTTTTECDDNGSPDVRAEGVSGNG
jgi:hypothetical protein